MAQEGKKVEFGLFDGALDRASNGSSSTISSGISIGEQVADKELQEKLEVLPEDKEEEEELTTKWRAAEDAIELLAKKKRRKDRFCTQRVVQVLKTLMPTTQLIVPIVQLSLTTPKKEDMEFKEIVREMEDLQIKLARLEEKTSTISSKATFKQGEFDEMVQQGIVYWRDGKVALKDTGDLFQTNFDKGGMKALVKDYLAIHGISTMEVATTYLKGVLEEHVFDAKVEFILKEILGIGKKEFYDVIIDSIKQKRQLMGEVGLNHAIDAHIYEDKEDVFDNCYK
uniref:Predicted protein n=1 Tax=Physcomitrium patens TaxID=3218 RepID=A9U4H2_PHYPA